MGRMTEAALINTCVRLARLPLPGPLTADVFALVDEPLPPLSDGQVCIETAFASVDAGHRAMIEPGVDYVLKIPVGGALPCAGVVGRVVRSRHSGYAVGDAAQVFTFGAWQTYVVPTAASGPVFKVDAGVPALDAYVGLLGNSGFTAYIGIYDIGKPTRGETVVISAAAGSVGIAAGQYARLCGARVIGVAGGREKCEFLVRELGFDACVDRRDDVSAQLDAYCPAGIDVYFDNVGGAVTEAVWPRLRTFARVVMCGQIAQYGASTAGTNLFAATLKRLTIRGFLAFDHYDRVGEFQQQVGRWYREGHVRHISSAVRGFAQAHVAVNDLVEGRSYGKQVIAV